MSVLGELKRRKVVQVATAYAVVAWILIQIVTEIEEPLGLPAWVDTFVIVCLGLGFPIALILSWALDVTPDGIKVTGKAEPGAPAAAPTLTYVMQGLVLLAVSFLVIDQYFLSDRPANGRTVDVVVTRFSIAYPVEDLEFQVMRGRTVAISPDGQNLAISRPDGLMVRAMNSLDERVVVQSGRLNSLMFSPDGQSIAYWDEANQQIKRVAISGGAPAVVGSTDVRSPHGVSWEADGAIWFAGDDGIYRVPADGGEPPQLIIAIDGDKQALGPTLLPDNDSILFSLATPGEWDSGEILVESLSTHERKVLLAGGSNVHYLQTGHLIYALGTTIYARQFDLDTLSVSGEAIALVENVIRADMVWQTGVAQFDVSPVGTVVYATAERNRSRQLVWVDMDGREITTNMEPGDFDISGISPQGSHVLLRQARPENTVMVWDLENESMTHLTVGPNGGDSPTWMPDGENIVFHPGTGPVIDIISSDNIGNPRRLVTGAPGTLDPFHPIQVLPSGTEILIEGRSTTATRLDIGMVAANGNGEVEWLLTSPATEKNPVISPDGRWLAYLSDESGRDEVFVRPYPNVDAGREQVSNRGGIFPVWGPEGNELYYLELGRIDRMMAVEVDASQSGFSYRNRRFVLDWPYAARAGGNFDISPDGQRFLALKPLTNENVMPEIVVVQNWFEELKERVPLN